MPRGPYKQYLRDVNVPVPATTLRRRQQNGEEPELQPAIEAWLNEDNHGGNEDELSDASLSAQSGRSAGSRSDEDMDIDEQEDARSNMNASRSSRQSSHSRQSIALVGCDSDEGSDRDSNSSFNGEGAADITESEDSGDDIDVGVDVEFDEQNDVERQTIYEGCGITLHESKLMIMTFAMRFALSDQALGHLVKLIDSHLPHNSHGSLHMFLKDMPKLPEVKTHYYCSVKSCQRLLLFGDGEENLQCECSVDCVKSELQSSGKYFIQIPLKEQLEKLLSENNVSNIQRKLRRENDNESDVISGKVYKSLRRKGTISQSDITLQINTDGVQIFKSSKNELWPIQVSLNELSYRERRDNILLCGIWVGAGKPNMNTYLKPFVDELKELHLDGFWCNGVQIKCHVLVASVDSMARAPMQNLKTFRGKQGCSFCLHEGEECAVGRGFSRVYRGDLGEMRTAAQHLNDTADVIRTHSVVNGIKGPSVLLFLPVFNIITSFVPEYMHNLLLGCVRSFVGWWTLGKNSEEPFYIGSDAKINEIDEFLLKIKPPSEVTRTPRSLHQRKLWKAHEWKNFLVYYSLVIFLAIKFPKKYLDHWFLLVYSMSVFLQDYISDDDFERATAALRHFVLSIETVYGAPELMRFNTHLMLHIPQSIISYGSLWSVSAFPYEHYNGILGKMFRSTQAVPQQICKSYLRLQAMKEPVAELIQRNRTPEFVKDFLENITGRKRTMYSSKVDDALRLLGIPDSGTFTLVQKTVVQNLIGEDFVNADIRFYKRFIYKNVLHHVEDYQRMTKRTNNVIQTRAGDYLSITHVTLISTAANGTQCVILGFKFHCAGEPLCSDRQLHVNSNSFVSVVEKTNECVAIYATMLKKKCLITQHPTNRGQFCIFPLVNSKETD